MNNLPVELLELFEVQVEGEYPFAGYSGYEGNDGLEYETSWRFNVHEGVGILKCSLRDVQGNEEDFEWELILK